MSNAKKIELFLPDGNPINCIICTVANWDGKILRIPKSLLTHYSNRPELQYTGIYFLIGGQDNPQLYIGEAENLYSRLSQHLNEDFWNECLVVTKMENNINKAHAKYLENHFYQLAKKIGRCKIVNSCIPAKSSISEADEATMDDFSQKIVDTISVMGYRFLVPLIDSTISSVIDQFEIPPTKARPNIRAKAIYTNEGLVILKGSNSAQHFSSASTKSLKTKWEGLRTSGIIKNNTFIKDYLASSPSMAAAMILGHNANGLTEWKTKDGECLKDFLENKQQLSMPNQSPVQETVLPIRST